MSPSNFNNWGNANEFNVNSSGELTNNNTGNGYGVRPISYYKLVITITNEPHSIGHG